MSSVCIQVINPNTSLAMTETIGAAARAVAAPGTEILAVCPTAGVPSIEGHFDEAIAAVGVLEQVKLGRQQGVDGHVIACFGDPGLLAARELASGPVVGIAEAAMHTATMLATRFSIVTTLPRTLVIATWGAPWRQGCRCNDHEQLVDLLRQKALQPLSEALMHHFEHIVASLCFERAGECLPDFARLFAGHKES